MSAKETQEGTTTEKPTQPAQPKPTTEQMLEALLKGQEALAKGQDENKKNIDMLAKAIVEVNKKVEANPSKGSAKDEADVLTTLADLLKPKGGSLDDLAKQAESFVKVADALDRFRHPSRIGVGEALLMRAGMRSIYPRYMTKEEIKRAEKSLGVWEALEETGETEHVT